MPMFVLLSSFLRCYFSERCGILQNKSIFFLSVNHSTCDIQGITYDTGGADIKAGGIMAGMHRDKCGAATVAGFFKVSYI